MTHRFLATAILAALTSTAAHAQLTPAITYQGELQASGAPVSGLYDLKFRLYSAASGGAQVAPELCADNIAVTDGRFSVELDFGPFTPGQDRFLEIDVRPDAGLGCGAGAGYTTLAARQKLTSAPFALAALSSLNAVTLNGQQASFYLNAGNLLGSLPDARLSSNVSLRGGTNAFTGANTFSNAGNSFTGSGAGLTGLNATNLASGTLADARLSSNVALRNAANAFSGANTFSNPSNTFAGNGAALTNLSASAISTGTIAEARLPFLAGDITGLHSNNRVSQLQGFPLSSSAPETGQVLKFSGTQWIPAADLTVFAGAGLTQSGGALGIAANGVTATMLAADRASLGKITQTLLETFDDGVNPPSIRAHSAGASSSVPGVLSVAGGNADQLVLSVEGANAAPILLLAGRGATNMVSGGYVDIEAGNAITNGSGGQIFMRAGHGGSPTSGRGGFGGAFDLAAGNGGIGRNADSGMGGDFSISAGDSPTPVGAGARDRGGNIYLSPGAGLTNGGVGINVPALTSFNADLRIRGNGTLARVVLESGGADQVAELLFAENTSNTNGVYLREDGAANALQVIDLTAGGETQIAAFDRDTNGFSAGIKAFKIDHPLDPANKFLYHSCVESPDMMNIYNGNVTTNAEGYAEVELPAYFSALNRDYRYQLTVLDDSDEFILAKVVRKIDAESANEPARFTLRTSRGGVEVSWMVTGVRHDALADKHRIVPEVDKPAAQKGKLLHPDAFEPAARVD